MAEIVKVLLVDDNPKYLEDVLPYYGFEVVIAYDGEQALSVLEEQTVDIVLLDIMMPKKNGWDTLKEIRNSTATKNLPVIMVSAITDTKKIVTALKMGADDYITKPLVLPLLLAKIEAVLRRAKRTENEFSKNVTINQTKSLETLTQREKDVLLLVATGYTNKDIADKLVLSQVTVKSHINSIMKKLNVNNRVQASVIALRSNLTEL